MNEHSLNSLSKSFCCSESAFKTRLECRMPRRHFIGRSANGVFASKSNEVNNRLYRRSVVGPSMGRFELPPSKGVHIPSASVAGGVASYLRIPAGCFHHIARFFGIKEWDPVLSGKELDNWTTSRLAAVFRSLRTAL